MACADQIALISSSRAINISWPRLDATRFTTSGTDVMLYSPKRGCASAYQGLYRLFLVSLLS